MAILDVLAGGALTVAGGFVAQWWQARRERTAREHARQDKRRDQLIDVYKVAFGYVLQKLYHPESQPKIPDLEMQTFWLFAGRPVQEAFHHAINIPMPGSTDQVLKDAADRMARAIREHLTSLGMDLSDVEKKIVREPAQLIPEPAGPLQLSARKPD